MVVLPTAVSLRATYARSLQYAGAQQNRLRKGSRAYLLLAWALGLWLLVACGPSAAPLPAELSTPGAAPPAVELPPVVAGEPAEAIPWLIRAEREAASQGDLGRLAALWAADGRAIDRRGRPPNGLDAAHDYVWTGRDAVLSRYVVAVFPHAPPPLAPDALDGLPLQVEGETVYAANGLDRWRFAWREGRWWIQELSYDSG
jgi:hypothetical protein